MLLRLFSWIKGVTAGDLRLQLFFLLPLFMPHTVYAGFPSDENSKPILEFVITEYPPFIGEGLLNKGLVTDICVQAFERMGYQVNVTSYPFARAMYLLRSGVVDGFLGLWFREERSVWANYSHALVSQDIVLIKRADHDIEIDNWQALHQYRIGTVLGYVNPPIFNDNVVETEAVSTDKVNFRKLLFGRIDMALTGRDVAEYFMKKSRFPLKENLEIIPGVLGKESFHFAVSRKKVNHQELVNELERGVLKLKQEGRLTQVFAEHSFDNTFISQGQF